MKNILVVIFLGVGIQTFGQPSFAYQPYFSAVVVKNLQASVKWYQSVFDLQVKSEMKDPNQAYSIVVLESGNYLLELLELRGH